MDYDNSAGRLATILDGVKLINKETRALEGWAHLLDAENASPGDLFQKIGRVFQLADEAADLARSHLSDGTDQINHWHSRMRQMATQNLHTDWNNAVLQFVDNHTLNYLKMSAKLLSISVSTKRIAPDDLAKLDHTIAALLDDFDQADLPDEIRTYSIRHLLKISKAIQEYRFFGATPILDEVEAMIGHVTDPTYKSFLTSPGLGLRLQEGLTNAASIVTVSLGLPLLTTPISNLFLVTASAIAGS